MREDERIAHLSKNWNLKGAPIVACLEKFSPEEQEEAMDFLEEDSTVINGGGS